MDMPILLVDEGCMIHSSREYCIEIVGLVIASGKCCETVQLGINRGCVRDIVR